MRPAPLTTSRPRDVRFTAAGRFLTAIAVGLLLAAVGVPALIFRHQQRQAAEQRELVAHGVVTDAEVVRRWKPSGEKNREMLAYRYVVDGQVYDAQSKVWSSLVRGMSPGSLLKVRYLPSDARHVVIEGAFESDLPLVLPYIVGVTLAVLSFVGFASIRGQVRLLAEGRMATAVVTGIKKQQSSHGGTHRSATYTFRVLSGATVSGRADVSRKPPAVGSTVEVIYDPERPQKSRLYPLSLVRPA